jgi:hypothetical protein
VVSVVTAPAPPTPLLTDIGSGVVGKLESAANPAPAVPSAGAGVAGTGSIGAGVLGIATDGNGVEGTSSGLNGVRGESTAPGGLGVYGVSAGSGWPLRWRPWMFERAADLYAQGWTLLGRLDWWVKERRECPPRWIRHRLWLRLAPGAGLSAVTYNGMPAAGLVDSSYRWRPPRHGRGAEADPTATSGAAAVSDSGRASR